MIINDEIIVKVLFLFPFYNYLFRFSFFPFHSFPYLILFVYFPDEYGIVPFPHLSSFYLFPKFRFELWNFALQHLIK